MASVELVSLARQAAHAQERWHNGEVTEDVANHAIARFEIAAAAAGYVKIIWAGLYPLVEDAKGRQETIS